MSDVQNSYDHEDDESNVSEMGNAVGDNGDSSSSNRHRDGKMSALDRIRREKRLAMNRESARNRRKRKKILINTLEDQVSVLNQKMQEMRSANEGLIATVRVLESELISARETIGRLTVQLESFLSKSSAFPARSFSLGSPGPHCALGGTGLDGSSLRASGFGEASLRAAGLGEASLRAAGLGEASRRAAGLGEASLRETGLGEASLRGAGLGEASFRAAGLDRAGLGPSDLPQTKFAALNNNLDINRSHSFPGRHSYQNDILVKHILDAMVVSRGNQGCSERLGDGHDALAGVLAGAPPGMNVKTFENTIAINKDIDGKLAQSNTMLHYSGRRTELNDVIARVFQHSQKGEESVKEKIVKEFFRQHGKGDILPKKPPQA